MTMARTRRGLVNEQVYPTWDPLFKGANTVLSVGNRVALVTGLQEWVRCTLGRDPATSAIPRQWETDVPATVTGYYIRPGWGMVDEDLVYADGIPGYGNIHGWTFGFGSAGIENDFYFHNSMVSSNWSGGSHGGQAHTMSFVWYPQATGLHAAGDINVYMDGVFLATVAGVTSGAGKKMYPIFSSGSSAPAGTNFDQGTVRLGEAAFAYPVTGASSWHG